MLEHPSTNGGTGHTNVEVHAEQRALMHYAALHPGGTGARHTPLRHESPRRYGLHRAELTKIHDLVETATSEALSHDRESPEWVAHRIADATERALFAVGVELLP